MNEFKHISVLKEEAIAGLNIKADGIYVDATLGGAGHASVILSHLNELGHLYCFDQDVFAIRQSEKVLSDIKPNFTIINSNFKHIKQKLNEQGVTKVDGILYDLGVSSFQFDITERGFSYNKDAELDMRMDQSQHLDAKTIVNTYTEQELSKIFFVYGEEKFSRQIARRIVQTRAQKEIETTFELVEVIKKALPAAVLRKGSHPAKKIFQALRIAVNDELRVFETSLKDALTMLNPDGRIAVITFHSLEDRICKNIFKEHVEVDIPRGLPILDKDIKREFELINKKVIIPSELEVLANNRSRSAKLRIIKKL